MKSYNRDNYPLTHACNLFNSGKQLGTLYHALALNNTILVRRDLSTQYGVPELQWEFYCEDSIQFVSRMASSLSQAEETLIDEVIETYIQHRTMIFIEVTSNSSGIVKILSKLLHNLDELIVNPSNDNEKEENLHIAKLVDPTVWDPFLVEWKE
jgi:hypothetical protein